jgi:hypothetical protein
MERKGLWERHGNVLYEQGRVRIRPVRADRGAAGLSEFDQRDHSC